MIKEILLGTVTLPLWFIGLTLFTVFTISYATGYSNGKEDGMWKIMKEVVNRKSKKDENDI